jgi:hypothetical protein
MFGFAVFSPFVTHVLFLLEVNSAETAGKTMPSHSEL